MKPTNRIIAAVALALTSVAVLFVGPAAAHNAEESYVYLDVSESTLTGRIDFPFVGLREALGFELDPDADTAVWEAELNGRYDDLVAYADAHYVVEDYGLTFGEIEFLFEDVPGQEINFVILPYEAAVTGATVPRQLTVTFNPFFEEIDDKNALVIVQNDWKAGVFDNGEGQNQDFVFTYDANSQTQVIDLGDASWWKNFTSSIELGVDHIKTGPDHILFVLVLLLPSVLIFTGGSWKPSNSFGGSLWRVLKIVTMFTVAHSITFTLAGLDLIPLPSVKVTESIIALSIAAAALHNLRPIFPNREWVIAFVFGLFHGLGFASLVSGLEVDRSTQLISLLGRNVGIEIGQAVVILVCFPLLYLLRNTVLYRWVMLIGSGVLAVVALLWMYERIFEADVALGSLNLNNMVEKFTRFPRSVFVIALLTLVAAGFQLNERRNNRLVDEVDLPTIDSDRSDDRELVEV
ncbi:MAG: HupE/UreJ family protein [Acidimicrobiales bacterium]